MRRTLWVLVIAGVAAQFSATSSMFQAPAQPAQTPAPPPGPGADAGRGPAQAQGGRGRGNPAAVLYAERCAGCHGTDTAQGRAPSLFDDQWTRAKDDEGIAAVIAEGVPQTEMIPFKTQLNDQQIWQLVAYLRTTAANARPKPAFVADPDGQTITSEKQAFRIEVLARDIETPWGLAFLPDGRLLVTERAGKLRIIPKDAKGDITTVAGTPAVWERQDAGLFDVEVHPQYAKNGWIYLAYAEPLANYTPPPPAPVDPGAAPSGRGGRGPQTPSTPSMTTIVRGKIGKDNRWTDQQVVFRAAEDLFTAGQYAFRLPLHLRPARGTSSTRLANVASWPTRRICPSRRVRSTGSTTTGRCRRTIRSSAPPGAIPTIWSYGHRNPQGLAWDPVTGRLWESEHGPQGGDEINIIEPGRNYGWGVVTMGVQNGIAKRSEPGMEQPIVYYTPTIAPSGIAFYSGDQYPAVEEPPVRQRSRGPAAAPSRGQRWQGHRAGSIVQPVRPRSRRDPGTRWPALRDVPAARSVVVGVHHGIGCSFGSSTMKRHNSNSQLPASAQSAGSSARPRQSVRSSFARQRRRASQLTSLTPRGWELEVGSYRSAPS